MRKPQATMPLAFQWSRNEDFKNFLRQTLGQLNDLIDQYNEAQERVESAIKVTAAAQKTQMSMIFTSTMHRMPEPHFSIPHSAPTRQRERDRLLPRITIYENALRNATEHNFKQTEATMRMQLRALPL